MPESDSPTTPLLELENAGYSQQQTEILRGVDWSVFPGQRWAVLGPNGSGKTTLLRVATGFLWHSSGIARRFGKELIDLAELRERTGWVAADLMTRIPADEKAIETVISGRRGQIGLRDIWTRPWHTDQDVADAHTLLEGMGLRALAEKPVRVLSQGECLQVLVARARMTNALLLVLDEPCAGMDPGVRERFLAWLGEQMLGPSSAQQTMPAIAMITHHVEEVLPEFDRALLVGKGRIVASGPPSEVLTAESLAATYQVGVARIEEHAGRKWPIWTPA